MAKQNYVVLRRLNMLNDLQHSGTHESLEKAKASAEAAAKSEPDVLYLVFAAGKRQAPIGAPLFYARFPKEDLP